MTRMIPIKKKMAVNQVLICTAYLGWQPIEHGRGLFYQFELQRNLGITNLKGPKILFFIVGVLL
jgi:hypothetical protein